MTRGSAGFAAPPAERAQDGGGRLREIASRARLPLVCANAEEEGRGRVRRGKRKGGKNSSCRPNSSNTLLVVILEKQIMPLGATHLYLTYVNVLYLHSWVSTTVDLRSRRWGLGWPRDTKEIVLSFSPDLPFQPLALLASKLWVRFATDAISN